MNRHQLSLAKESSLKSSKTSQSQKGLCNKQNMVDTW